MIKTVFSRFKYTNEKFCIFKVIHETESFILVQTKLKDNLIKYMKNLTEKDEKIEGIEK